MDVGGSGVEGVLDGVALGAVTLVSESAITVLVFFLLRGMRLIRLEKDDLRRVFVFEMVDGRETAKLGDDVSFLSETSLSDFGGGHDFFKASL